MALPTSRLDLYVIPSDHSERAVQLVEERLENWSERGLDVVAKRIRVDDPKQVVLYANQVGGFQVRCPHCDLGLAREFRPFSTTRCPSCKQDLPFDVLICRPPAALGRAALVLCDVDRAVWEDSEGWTLVLRRV